ncbi:hypothetical protein SESBI_32010, partial [Sesbania bispinosa]
VPSHDYPDELDGLVGRELLFKVEIKEDRAFKFDDSFMVRRVCDDEDIISQFKDAASVKTPEMSKMKEPVFELVDDAGGSSNGQVSGGDALGELYNESEINASTVGESSIVSACLAPQKRKAAPRGGKKMGSKGCED